MRAEAALIEKCFPNVEYDAADFHDDLLKQRFSPHLLFRNILCVEPGGERHAAALGDHLRAHAAAQPPHQPLAAGGGTQC